MKYILESHMLCICALYSKRQQIKFFEKIFDRCARSPREFLFFYYKFCKQNKTDSYSNAEEHIQSCNSGVSVFQEV